MIGSSSLSFTLDASNLPRHNHDIYYNNTGDVKGGIWGTNNANGGNYGYSVAGNGTYAKTAPAGYDVTTKTVTLPIPPSVVVYYYVCAK